MFEVSANHPIPQPSGSRGRPALYPWDALNIGDSFYIPNRRTQDISVMASARGKRDGHRYSCRTEDGGVRIWRIA